MDIGQGETILYRQLIVVTGVEDLPSAQALLHCQPEVHQLMRAVCKLLQTSMKTQATFHQPFQDLFLFPWNSMVTFITTLILAHPFGMKTSHHIAPTFHTLQLLLSPA